MTDLGQKDLASGSSTILSRYRSGERFAALIADGDPATGMSLHALLAGVTTVEPVDIELPPGTVQYRSLTPDIPPAFWYERAIHDLHGITPTGHPRLDPLVLPHRGDQRRLPCPGSKHPAPDHIEPDERAWPRRVTGRGLFTIPHGPVRSGVFESVEFVVETPGEDIPHVNVRPFAKHRGAATRLESLPRDQAVLMAERVEGVASVAHALAFCHAWERQSGATPPRDAALTRVLHAELERIANHLDVAMKLADAAGLAVAIARFGWHKESILRLISQLCGNRFGRGVVIPGGVTARPRLTAAQLHTQLDTLRSRILSDLDELVATASFLDRLRGTGPLDPTLAAGHGVLGPVGRASGQDNDARWNRPYDGYAYLTRRPGPERDSADALARLQVRCDEITEAFHLLEQVVGQLDSGERTELCVPLETTSGTAVGWAEAPQGEVLYFLRTDSRGTILRCAPRSASFHNLAVFSQTFTGDILTDFPFIEASFGVSIAGVVM